MPGPEAPELARLLQLNGIEADAVTVDPGDRTNGEMMLHMASRMQRPVIERSLREEGLPEAVVQAVCARVAQHYVPWQEATFPGLLGNVVAGRIANRFDLGGTNCVIDAACASSLAALAMAMSELRSGQADTVLTGGVDALNEQWKETAYKADGDLVFCHRQLGTPLDRVTVVSGDTGTVPFDLQTSASRSTVFMGAAVLEACRTAGLTLLVADGRGELDLHDPGAAAVLAGPTAWVFGGEAHGLAPELAAAADHRVRVPIHGRAESLNLATAAAVCLYASAQASRTG